MKIDIGRLISICESSPRPSLASVRVKEPYIPYFPPDRETGGVLVLAEAQNHGKSSENYVRALRKLPTRERITRLGRIGEGVGIQPWDDGSLKLAIEAAFKLSASEAAVSNAVLWSEVTEKDINKTPSQILRELSADLWRQMLEVIQPSVIITAGKIACDLITNVIEGSKNKPQQFKLRLPSPFALARISGMFSEDDLLSRYPEVARVVNKYPELVKKHRTNKVFFACHAVSLYSKKR